jgi:DNA-binding PadR family transcriptional regulator
VALQLIAEKPRHGYEIIKAIEEKSGGCYTPSAGAVYPTLTLLEELGHLSVNDSGDGRKLYTITPEGAASLVANRKSVDAIFARIAQVEAIKESDPRIKDALRRLKHTLRLRQSSGPLDDAQVANVVARLDEIRDAIEQD